MDKVAGIGRAFIPTKKRFPTKRELMAMQEPVELDATKLVENLNAQGIVDLRPKTYPHKGLFVVLEGGEGSGKSTQAKMLVDALQKINVPCFLTREPGATELGADLRKILLDRDRQPMSRKAELFLFLADRTEHVEKVIRPALERGEVVVCDRYMASTLAYQCYAGGLDVDVAKTMSGWASDDLVPDITYFLDVQPATGLERSMRVEHTRFEDKSVAYHDKVRRGYRHQKDGNWVVVDAEQTIEEVHNRIVGHLWSYHSSKLQPPAEKKPVVLCLMCSASMDPDPVVEGLFNCPQGCGSMRFAKKMWP